MNSREETQYITLLSRGDQEAFRVLFEAYYPRVAAFIVRLLKSDFVAEDMAQDIFVRIWIMREHLVDIDSFSSYLFRMAKNAVYDYARHRITTDKYINKYKEVLDPALDEQFSAQQTALLIKLVVEHMPEQRRRIFEMSRYAGRNNDEIAIELSIAKKTVENHLNLALHEIKALLAISLLICSLPILK